jgi:hypothetical protein
MSGVEQSRRKLAWAMQYGFYKMPVIRKKLLLGISVRFLIRTAWIFKA